MFKSFVNRVFLGCLFASAFAAPFLAAESKRSNPHQPLPQGVHRSCGDWTLRGVYGTNITGTFLVPPAPGDSAPPTAFALASVGRLAFDGSGNVSGTDTNSFNGNLTVSSVNGWYAINRDCTGTLEVTLEGGFVISNDLVVVDGGRQAFLIQTNPGTIITGVMKRF